CPARQTSESRGAMLMPVRCLLKVVSETDASVVSERGSNKLNSDRQLIFREAARNGNSGQPCDIRCRDDAMALVAMSGIRRWFYRRFIRGFVRGFFSGLVAGF